MTCKHGAKDGACTLCDEEDAAHDKAMDKLASEPVQEPVAWLSRDEARLALWEAIHKRDYGNPTDDKLILEALHKAGFWIGRLVTAEPQAEPVRECADNDSPWLICKPCAAVGRCAKLPVAWRSKERINGEFDSGWKLTSNEPPQTPRTIAIEPLYTHPPQQRKPLTGQQILDGWVSTCPSNSSLETFEAGVRFAESGIGEAP